MADIMMAVAELFEAEMAAARQSIVRLLVAGAFIVTSIVLMAMAVILVTWGLYVLLMPLLGVAGAAFGAAAILLAAALLLILSAKWYVR
jgi:hypothetical protein